MKFKKDVKAVIVYKILFCIILFSIFSCNNDDCKLENDDLQIDKIATISGDLNSHTVLLYLQGGPVTELEDIGEIISLSSTAASSITWVQVQQAQTLNPDLINKGQLTFEEAKKQAMVNAEIVNKIVNHYKIQGKEVYLLGVSYGAFIAQDYIARYGISKIKKAIIAVGRLDLEDQYWTGFAEGNTYLFELDEITSDLVLKYYPDDEYTVPEEKNLMKLSAALTYKRYTNLLANVEGLDRIHYYSGTNDVNVGRLTKNEKDFLKSKNIQLTEILRGDHQIAIEAALKDLKAFFEIKS